MSYNNDIFAMSTLAHELGHSMHSYYSRRSQPFIYSSYGLFQAEVASNMHQALTRRHLLATKKDRDFQIAVIEEAMSNFSALLLHHAVAGAVRARGPRAGRARRAR